MLSPEEKRRLEDQFLLDDFMPDQLGAEEQEYWIALSDQWNQSLLSLYERIARRDSHVKNPKIK